MFNKYAPYYDLFYLNRKPYKRDCEFIYEWARQPDKMLDLCCGTANYWKFWPTDDITGVDISEEMIKQSLYSAKIIHADVLKFPFNGIGIFDCATCLFNAINYLPRHDWWGQIPIKKGGYFIFDIWNLDKIKEEGWSTTNVKVGKVWRRIEAVPSATNTKVVTMNILVKDGGKMITETHPMYLYSQEDIERFCKDEFEIAEIRQTPVWHVWYKLIKL